MAVKRVQTLWSNMIVRLSILKVMKVSQKVTGRARLFLDQQTEAIHSGVVEILQRWTNNPFVELHH